MSVEIVLADLEDEAHGKAIVNLLDMYARDEMGSGQGLSDDVRRRLLPGLRRQPTCRVFLAFEEDEAAGLAICFLGFSSFRAAPLLNVHDLAVRPQSRGRGIGRMLLSAIEAEARCCNCCKLTLEVRADNHTARGLYHKFGFYGGEGETTAMSFWAKEL